MRKQSFLTGALILMIANAISKILGAVFKIPLTYILNEEGMAVYNTAFQIYIMFLSFIISGFPFAVSKNVAEAISKKSYGEARKTVTLATLVLSVAGLFGSVILYFGAPCFALSMKEEGAIYAIRAISPAVFFVALGTAYKSYFQGAADMIPIAVSQVVESVIKLGAGFMLSYYCINLGMEITSAGAICGVTIGEIFATLILFLGYIRVKKEKRLEKVNTKDILKPLFSVALPLMAATVSGNALNILETAVIRNRLIDSGIGEDNARFLYGAYTGYAQTVFHLPAGILATIGVSILPVIAGTMALGNKQKAMAVTNISIKLTVLLSVPCAVVMYLMPEELLYTLFKNTASALMLKMIAPCIIPVCISQIIISVLQSAGKIGAPFVIMVITSILKIGITYILTGIRELNIYGAIIASCSATVLSMLLEYAVLYKNLRLKIGIMEIIIKPTVSGLLMAGAIYSFKPAVNEYFGGGFLSFVIICAVSVTVYGAMLFLTKAIRINEVRKVIKM